MSAPALALIVPIPGNRSQPESGKPGTMTAGPGGKTGPSCPKSHAGGASAAFRYRQAGNWVTTQGYRLPPTGHANPGRRCEPRTCGTLFRVRTVAKHCARASRIGHREEGPVLPRATCGCTTGKTVMGANAATARAWSHFNAPRRPIGEPRDSADKKTLCVVVAKNGQRRESSAGAGLGWLGCQESALKGHPESGHPWQPIRPPDTPARHRAACRTPASDPASSSTPRRTRRAPYGPASRWRRRSGGRSRLRAAEASAPPRPVCCSPVCAV